MKDLHFDEIFSLEQVQLESQSVCTMCSSLKNKSEQWIEVKAG